MSFLYRCTKVYKSGQFKGQRCYQRHSFKKKIEQYVNPKVCSCCKNEITYIDKWQKKKNKENICTCGEPHYPHREGATVWCIKSKKQPSEDDHKSRYG